MPPQNIMSTAWGLRPNTPRKITTDDNGFAINYSRYARQSAPVVQSDRFNLGRLTFGRSTKTFSSSLLGLKYEIAEDLLFPLVPPFRCCLSCEIWSFKIGRRFHKSRTSHSPPPPPPHHHHHHEPHGRYPPGGVRVLQVTNRRPAFAAVAVGAGKFFSCCFVYAELPSELPSIICLPASLLSIENTPEGYSDIVVACDRRMGQFMNCVHTYHFCSAETAGNFVQSSKVRGHHARFSADTST